MTDYPQHDKLTSLDGANQTVGNFIEWLGENGYHICIRLIPRQEGHEYWPTMTTRDEFIAAFFEIDAKELSREKDRMLEEFRGKQHAEPESGVTS
jgi:hypothetical protein